MSNRRIRSRVDEYRGNSVAQGACPVDPARDFPACGDPGGRTFQGLLRTLARMIREGSPCHADMIELDVPGRLAKWLLQRVDAEDPGGLRPGSVVHLQRSQGELAAELGTTRSTLNRALHDFEALGFLAIDGDDVTLLKPWMLQTYAS